MCGIFGIFSNEKVKLNDSLESFGNLFNTSIGTVITPTPGLV